MADTTERQSIVTRMEEYAEAAFRSQRRRVIDLLRSDAREPLCGSDLSELQSLTAGRVPDEALEDLAAAAAAVEAGTATDEQRATLFAFIERI